MMSIGVVGIQIDGSPDSSFCGCTVPVVIQVDECLGGVSLSQRIVKLEGLRYCLLCPGKGFPGGEICVPRLGKAAVSPPVVGQGVTRIFVNSLLEVLDCFPQALFRPLVPEMAASAIRNKGLGVGRTDAGKARLRLGCNRDANLAGNGPRYFVQQD